MKTHLPSRLRPALLTALASVSIPTLAAATLVTFSTQAAAEYMPANDSFKKDWTTETPTSYTVSISSSGTSWAEVNIANVKVTGQTGSVSQPQVRFITRSATDRIYYADIAATSTKTTYKPRYFGAFGSDSTGPNTSMAGSMYMRNSAGGNVQMLTGATYVRLSGSVYIELNGDAKYLNSVYAADRSIIGGSCNMVITKGQFSTYLACVNGNSNADLKVTSGTFLEIDGGTFNTSRLAAGAEINYIGTIEGGTHLLITKGTFTGGVCAGAWGSSVSTGKPTVKDGVHACIKGGSFSGDIYGGTVEKGDIHDGIDFTITGGAYSGTGKGIYASGSGGTVNSGSVSLTLRGDDASFADNYVISAGGKTTGVTYGEGVTGRVTLAELTEASSLIKSTSAPQGIQVKGIATKDTVLEMSGVKGTLNAALSDFSSMEVKDGSTVTLTRALNETLGGVKEVNIAGDSTLALESAEGETWDLTVTKLDGAGSLYKTGEGTLTVSGDSSAFAGSMNIAEGTLEVQNNMHAKKLDGSCKLAKTVEGTMSVENASAFSGNIEVTGGTLQLENVKLTDAKSEKVSVSNGGVINLMNIADGTDGALIELDINGGEFGVYKSGYAITGDNDSNVGTLTLADGQKIVIGAAEGSKLEANLTTMEGSILDFTSGGQLTMGCELNVGEGTKIAISSSAYESLMNGNDITLFTGVDNEFSMDVTDYVICDLATASEGSGESKTKVYFQTVDGNAVLSTAVPTPEPTTSTLSLLALAGLCARRRRKH